MPKHLTGNTPTIYKPSPPPVGVATVSKELEKLQEWLLANNCEWFETLTIYHDKSGNPHVFATMHGDGDFGVFSEHVDVLEAIKVGKAEVASLQSKVRRLNSDKSTIEEAIKKMIKFAPTNQKEDVDEQTKHKWGEQCDYHDPKPAPELGRILLDYYKDIIDCLGTDKVADRSKPETAINAHFIPKDQLKKLLEPEEYAPVNKHLGVDREVTARNQLKSELRQELNL
jgi:hypothetical protein